MNATETLLHPGDDGRARLRGGPRQPFGPARVRPCGATRDPARRGCRQLGADRLDTSFARG